MDDIRDHLEIIIITYNRAVLLHNTMDALLKSPFKMCHISVLNNASTDNTIEICNSYQNKFPNLTIITNKINIGGNANILRAIETSNGKYTWVLCDDDEYDFSYCDDLIEAIIGEKAELIHVGAHTDVPWNFGGNINTPRNLLKNGYSFFRFSSFLPCNVFKTESFYPYIISCYNNIVNSYPHMPFFISFYEENKNIYITKNRIVKAVMGYQACPYKDFYLYWLNTALLLKKTSERVIMFRDPFLINSTIKKIIFPVSVLNTIVHYRFSIINHYNLFGFSIFLLSLILLPMYFLCFCIKELYMKLKNHSGIT